jgi:hypothetical protein
MSSIKSKISKSINSNKSLKHLNTKIDKTIGYSNKNIVIGFITVAVAIYVCMKLYNWYMQGFKFNDNNNNNNNNNDNNSVNENKNKEIVNYSKSGNVPTMKRPFLNLYAVMKDGKEIATNIVFITHSFTRDDCEVDYNKFKSEGIHFLGLSSYSEFPGKITNTHDVLNDPNHKAYSYNYFDLTRGWCSVFREEINQKLFPKGFPRIQCAESDFAKYKTHLPDPNVEKEYDFIYVCLKDGDRKEGDKDCPQTWQATIRAYPQAKQFIDLMCKKYKLKGLLIGRIGCEMPPNCHQLMELTDFQDYSVFIKNYNKCRFIFIPNYAEASCRVCTEAMCFNLPILMNKNILGGWNYVNEETGEFFDTNNIDTFEPILDKFVKKLNNNEYNPREWFIKNYGEYNSGAKLLNFVKSVFKEDELNIKYDEVQYVKPGI